MTAREAVKKISERHPWVNSWAQLGMVVYVTRDGKALELKKDQQLPKDISALGCGGWTESGQLIWVGLDFDVGHGAVGYKTKEQAIAAAHSVRNFVGGAAEIRLSKSGNGVHVRVKIADKIMDGRKVSGNIAKWLAKTLDIKADRSPLGRQNFWFWASKRNEESFKSIAECQGFWSVPPAALKDPEPEYRPAPVAPTTTTASEAIRRATQYASKFKPAIQGSGGDDHTFDVCRSVIRGFALTIDEARPIIYDWNRTCQPPWDEKGIERKMLEAYRCSRLPNGYILNDASKARPAKPIQKPPEVKRVESNSASGAVKAQIEQEIDGTRFAADWPWRCLSWSSLALLPGTVTILCAPGGSSKSFFLLQCLRYWMGAGYKVRIMQLEETLTFHLRRALAQISKKGEITDPSWTKANPDEARTIAELHVEEMDALAECMMEPQGAFDAEQAIRWVAKCVEDGCRIIAIDPITAKDESEKPWVDDKRFVDGVRKILKNSNTSLVLITHPPKNAKDTTLDNVAGGSAYQRFCQNVFYMAIPEEEESEIMVAKERSEFKPCNRKIYLRKLRNGRATNACICFNFNAETLCFEEIGLERKAFAKI